MAALKFSPKEVVLLRNKYKARILESSVDGGKIHYKIHVFEKADGSSFDWIPNQMYRQSDLIKIK